MNIKTIEEAKKYIDKIVYTAGNINARCPDAITKVIPLYIGGVHLFYNKVDYEVVGFEVYQNKNCTKNWGKIELENIRERFDSVNFRYFSYFFQETEAKKYSIWLNADEKEKEKERDITTAKELLNTHKIKFTIFD